MKVPDLLSLKGRVALVTGGSRGLGLQMAEALGEMGARLAITARKKEELEQATKQLEKQGIVAASFVCDMGKRETIAPVADEILKKFGKVDILVNNAGATWGAPAEEHPLEAWDKLLNLNLTAAFVLTQILGRKSMIPAKWGRVINIASIAGLMGQDPRIVRTIAYNTTKGGLVNFTRALAAEWGQHGITVNAICPGFFPSKMTQATLGTTGELIRDWTPTKRLGNDEDLKGLVVLLASEASRHITGQGERDITGDAKLAFTRDYQKRIPFVSHLKILTETLGEGTARLSLPIEPHLTNSIGTVHGGVIMSLLDVALCTAARTLHPDSLGVITIDMSTSFIGGGSGARLLAEARVLKNGRSMIFVDGEAKNEDGSLVAKAIATVRVRLKEK